MKQAFKAVKRNRGAAGVDRPVCRLAIGQVGEKLQRCQDNVQMMSGGL
jgi:hypothetical protein